MATNFNIDDAYTKAIKLAKSHYENFPVISFLVPKELRKHIAIIYWFARTADDFADEGDFSLEEKISFLEKFEMRFLDTINGKFEADYDAALLNTINEFNLEVKLFLDLISAFIQDNKVNRYKTIEDVFDYCSRSANPIGRLLLQLFGHTENHLLICSDKICTALQLTNFLQDISIDSKKGRIYIPLEELEFYKVSESQFLYGILDENYKALLQFQIKRANELFQLGYNLIPHLQGLFKYEILLTIKGGETILKKIELNNYDVFNSRPTIGKFEAFKIFISMFRR